MMIFHGTCPFTGRDAGMMHRRREICTEKFLRRARSVEEMAFEAGQAGKFEIQPSPHHWRSKKSRSIRTGSMQRGSSGLVMVRQIALLYAISSFQLKFWVILAQVFSEKYSRLC
jgi:hypothetical protein